MKWQIASLILFGLSFIAYPVSAPAVLFDAEAVEIIENSVGTLTTETVFTVPAGKRLIITDLVITNSDAVAAGSQRLARNGSFVTSFLTVSPESTLTHTFATGIEFEAGDEVQVRNGTSLATTHFYLRGYLVDA